MLTVGLEPATSFGGRRIRLSLGYDTIAHSFKFCYEMVVPTCVHPTNITSADIFLGLKFCGKYFLPQENSQVPSQENCFH